METRARMCRDLRQDTNASLRPPWARNGDPHPPIYWTVTTHHSLERDERCWRGEARAYVPTPFLQPLPEILPLECWLMDGWQSNGDDTIRLGLLTPWILGYLSSSHNMTRPVRNSTCSIRTGKQQQSNIFFFFRPLIQTYFRSLSRSLFPHLTCKGEAVWAAPCCLPDFLPFDVDVFWKSNIMPPPPTGLAVSPYVQLPLLCKGKVNRQNTQYT